MARDPFAIIHFMMNARYEAFLFDESDFLMPKVKRRPRDGFLPSENIKCAFN